MLGLKLNHVSKRGHWNLFTELISVFHNRGAANILSIDHPIVTKFRISFTLSIGCCLFDLDVIKPWIDISPMDQTKFVQLRTALLCESTDGCMAIRRWIIQWSQEILLFDIIISWNFLWDQRPASVNWNITWMKQENNTFSIKESLACPRVAHVEP